MELILSGAGILIVGAIFFIAIAISRYKTCPSNKILVKYGMIGGGKASKPVHGGATFVWPLIQDFAFLDLTPQVLDIDLIGALSKQNIRINAPCRFTIAVSTHPEVMPNAAERLLGMTRDEISATARDIIFGQLRATIATLSIEEINGERDKFEKQVMDNIESELRKVGLENIAVNISDISDESGYIEALGKKAAAEAINKARVDTANADRGGAEGEAIAKRDSRIAVAKAEAEASAGEAEASRERRSAEATQDALAIAKENEAKIAVEKSSSELRVTTAEAQRVAKEAEAIKEAEAERAAFEARAEAEKARALSEKERLHAELVVSAEAAKQRAIVQAQAEGETQTIHLDGLAQGQYEILTKSAEGFQKLVEAAGGDTKAALNYLIVDKLEVIAKMQTEAISNIKFDKVVVYDGGDGNAAADWMQGVTKALPGMHEFASLAGLDLPEILGKQRKDATETSAS